MDDQFGGRTDDDLFADDFEPVAEPPEAKHDLTNKELEDASRPPQDDARTQTQAKEPPPTAQPASATPPPPKSLAQSRHNKPVSSRPPRQSQAQTAKNNTSAGTSSKPTPAKPAATKPAPPKPSPNTEPSTTDATTTSSPSVAAAASTADTDAQPAPPTAASTSRNGTAPAKPDPNARLRSGANPRTKLTEEELAAKMEQMRILSAEKTRRFEQAQRDETDHAIAYARGMEEARKRRAAEEEKRRRGEEERRRMDDERAKNRERKLAALEQREGWDLGRDHVEEPEERRAFRGAHGGVRGARRGAGLAGSRFAEPAEERREFGERGGRGRGRGRGGRGRGGFFDGADRSDEQGREGAARASAAQRPPPLADDFPALPSSGTKKTATPGKAAPVAQPDPISALSPLSPAVGGWDDEMAAMDAKRDA